MLTGHFLSREEGLANHAFESTVVFDPSQSPLEVNGISARLLERGVM